MNLLDDSLSADLASAGRLTAAMTDRFLALAQYAVATGVDAILFTCSAYGPCIEACVAACDCPVLKPNEAMIEQATMLGSRIGLLATFLPTLDSMPREFPADVQVVPRHVQGALAALERGDQSEHDRLIARAARDLADCDVLALAQFSMAAAADVVRAEVNKPVLTTPDSAVRKLRVLLTTHDENAAGAR